MRSPVSATQICRPGAACTPSPSSLLRPAEELRAPAPSAAHGFDFTRVPAASVQRTVDVDRDAAKKDAPKDAPKSAPKDDAKKEAPKDVPKDAPGDTSKKGDAKEAPKVPTGPCGGASLASTVGPSDKRINGSAVTATLDASDFGNTSKLGADFQFGACKVGNEWRFHLDKLVVPVVSKVQDVAFRKDVTDASDALVTKDTYKDIIRDLSPTHAHTFGVSCGGQDFEDRVTKYSRRKTYWNHQLVVEHEAFHRKNWIEMYRAELVKAESDVWKHTLPAADAANAAAAVAKANTDLTKYMTDANGRVCAAYAPQKESRAYDDGEASYKKLVDAIQARATKEKW